MSDNFTDTDPQGQSVPEAAEAGALPEAQDQDNDLGGKPEPGSFAELMHEIKYGPDAPASDEKPEAPKPSDKFGGDYAKAVQSYQELERKLGEQGARIGQYEQWFSQQQQAVASPPQDPKIDPNEQAQKQFYELLNGDNPDPLKAVQLGARAAIEAELAPIKQALGLTLQQSYRNVMDQQWQAVAPMIEGIDRNALDQMIQYYGITDLAAKANTNPYALAYRMSPAYDPGKIKTQAVGEAERRIAENRQRGAAKDGPNLRSAGVSSGASMPAPAALGKLGAFLGVHQTKEGKALLNQIWNEENGGRRG